MGKDDFKDFLLEEYKAFTESMHRSEETGESRLTFFYTLSTAILGAVLFFLPKTFNRESLTGNINNQPDGKIHIIHILIVVLLFSLLVIGVIIQRRLKKRNQTTDRLIDRIASIREIFKNDFSDNLGSAKSYNPFPVIRPRRKRDFTSLADISWVMNIFILTIIVVLIIFFLRSNIRDSIAGGAITIVTATVHFFWVSKKEQ